MISIKDAVDQLAHREKLQQLQERLQAQEEMTLDAVAAYRQAVEQTQLHLFSLFPRAGQAQQPALRHILQKLDSSPPALAATVNPWSAALRAFAQDAETSRAHDLAMVRELLAILARAAEDSIGQAHASTAGFEKLSQNLEQLSAAPNLETLREGLSHHMGDLRAYVLQIVADHERSTSLLTTEMASYEGRVAELEALAATDPLTGIANRRAFEAALAAAVASDVNLSLLMFDLDGFKGINDRLGHEAGDQVLCHFARALRDEIRPQDLAARLGGDEFIVILHCPLAGAFRRGNQILHRLESRHEVSINGRSLAVPIRASIGVVEHREGENAAALLRRADEAMYAVKRRRKAGP